MKKENTIISSVLIALMLIIQICSLTSRVQYENDRKQIYISANVSDIKMSGLDIASALLEYKNAGACFATVSPKTVEDFEKEGRLSAISYSSLKINSDSISKSILPLLEPYGIKDDSILVLSNEESMTAYLKECFNNVYKDVITVNPDKNMTVFCFPNHNEKNIYVGYDEVELQLVKNSGLSLCLEYPAFSFEAQTYPIYLENFITNHNPQFIILRESDYPQSNLSKDIKDVFKASDVFLCVFENENQISNEKPVMYEDMKSAFYPDIVRGFNMDKVVGYDETKYMYRYYQWYNSALERNTTFLNANVLKNENTDENLKLTTDAIKAFISRFEKLGYTFPDKGTSVDYSYNLRLGAISGGVILVVLLYMYISLLGIFSGKNVDIYALLTAVPVIILSYALYDELTKYFALLTMIVSASLLTLMLFKLKNSQNSKKSKLLYMIIATVSLLFISAVSQTALLSDFNFFMGDKWFFGVKISLIVPIFATVYNYYVANHKGETLKEWLIHIKNEVKKINIWIIVTVAVLFLIVVAYYLIRTGKSDLVLPIEDKFRKMLTDIFVIRPRLKEFLIGYPAFSLFLYFGLKEENKLMTGIFGILMTILFTSVLNTFCHTFTVLWVNSARVLTGFIVGIIISGILLGILEIIKLLPQFFKKNK